MSKNLQNLAAHQLRVEVAEMIIATVADEGTVRHWFETKKDCDLISFCVGGVHFVIEIRGA